MTRIPGYLRLSLIALAAMAGMLSVAGGASACSEKPAVPIARGCCSGRPPVACLCCDPGVSAPVEAIVETPSTDLAPGEARLAASVPHCACRAEGPSAPASRPESRPAPDRHDRDRDASPDAGTVLRPASSTPLAWTSSVGAKTIPLFLRTSRLLI